MNKDDEIFWDRLADMPWIEAEQECVSRRERLALELAMLQSERAKLVDRRGVKGGKEYEALGVEISCIASQLTLLNERIRYLRKVQERVRWVDACKAILDHDTYMQIKVHMEMAEQAVRASCPPPKVPT